MFEIRKVGSRRVLKQTDSALSVAAWFLGRRVNEYVVNKQVSSRGWMQVDLSSAQGDVNVIQKLCEDAALEVDEANGRLYKD